MRLFNKFSRQSDTEDEDGLDLEDSSEATSDLSDGAPSWSRTLVRKALRWRIRGRADDQRRDESPPDDEGPSATLVRLEGAPDVRAVGPAAGAMKPPEAMTGAAPVAGPAAAPPGGAGDRPAAEVGQDKPSNDLDFALKGIFQERLEVDENLKFLADSQEQVAAADLASELRQLLSELQR